LPITVSPEADQLPPNFKSRLISGAFRQAVHKVIEFLPRCEKILNLGVCGSNLALGLRALKMFHSSIVKVPRPWAVSTHDWLSETKMIKSPFAPR